MWVVNDRGEKMFTSGKEAWDSAAQAAGLCPCFSADAEDEQVADEPLSCYNCRYRRWTDKSFVCRKS